jgi:hypothetical protein
VAIVAAGGAAAVTAPPHAGAAQDRGAQVAGAQAPGARDTTASAVASPPRSYAGVVPGNRERPSHVRGAPGQTPVVATWPGFQPRADGASRVFVQLTATAAYDVRTEGGRVVVLLRGVRIGDRQARRPLDTRYFETPVTRAYLERRGRADCALVLELRANVTPAVALERGEDGMTYLTVSFPSGQYRPAELAPHAGSGPQSTAEGGGHGYVTAGASGAAPGPSPSASAQAGPSQAALRGADAGAGVRGQAVDTERPPALGGRGPAP